MQIVIELSELDYKWITLRKGDETLYPLTLTVYDAIKNGTPLPKGHGRLIDADTLADGFEDNYEFCEVVNATPTIIEADKGEQE